MFAISPVVVAVMAVTVGIYDATRRWFYHNHTWWRRRGMVMPVTVPVAVVVTGIVGSVGTG
ncbi:MAG: hypothetical protein ACO1N1_07645 [Dyadobacter fermentans]